MFRKTLFFSVLTGLAIILTGATLLAVYENRYQEILRLRNESERIPGAERKAKAKQIAAKVFEKYQTTNYLSFKADKVDYWCKDGTLSSRLPMDWWRLRRHLAKFNLAMTPDSARTEVFVDNKPVYTFFQRDRSFSEYKHPWNGVPGMRTQYALDQNGDSGYHRLIRGVDPYTICVAGIFGQPWIGSNADRATKFKSGIEDGVWIGTTKVAGESCDVILLDRGWDRWGVYYVNSKGLLVMRNRVSFHVGKGDYTVIRIRQYTDISTEPIPPETFSPSAVLLEEAKSWRVLSDAESLAELEAELGQKINE